MDCQLNYCSEQTTTVLLAASHVIIGTIEFYAGGKKVVILKVPVCVHTALLASVHLQCTSAKTAFLVYLSVMCVSTGFKYSMQREPG